MKSHTDFFRSQSFVAFGQAHTGSTKLSDWIGSRSASLTAPTSAGYPQTLQSLDQLSPLFTFEAARFSSAALESYSTVCGKWTDPEDREGLAWQLVSLYYSAFYSAHAILRFAGISLTQIDDWKAIDTEFQTLYQSSSLPALGLQNGFHLFSLDVSGTSLSISKPKIDSKHGSHTVLWRAFRTFADNCYSNNALNTTLHKAAVEAYTQKLATSLMIDGTNCNWPWMPVIRNRINYRLPIEIWGSRSKRILPSINKHIHRLIASPTSDQIAAAASANIDWLRFSASCIYVVSLLCHMLRDMELRAKSKAFLPSVYRERADIISKICAA